MSHFRTGGLSRRRWALVVVMVVGSIASLVSYEEIERFRRNECSIYARLIYGLPSRSGLGLIVEHSIGYGESQEWTVLNEYESLEIRKMLGDRHWTEVDESGELTDGISMDMSRRLHRDEVVVSFIVSKELLERSAGLRQSLARPVECSLERFCSDLYFSESRVRVVHESRGVPAAREDGGRERPGIVIYIHGGGFVFGDMATYERILQRHAVKLGNSKSPSVVAYIEYRKSPKWRYPVPLEDVVASISWIHRNAERLGLDPSRLVVVGDSAGGSLAASSIASCLSIKQQSETGKNSAMSRKFHSYCRWVDHVRFLGLIYPALCQKCITNSKLKSFRLGFLTLGSLLWFEKQHQSKYLENYLDWRPQPLLAPANILRKFPRTSIVLMKSDILYDDGRLMYEILVKLKVKTKLRTFTGFHGTYGSSWLPGGRDALEFINDEISETMDSL
ncbi:lipase/esterase [Cryptosporidium canis]|uniref:Lipase/esterase n=1 Tax=Cryptosporidium canis TaxID=195482 RepID=A0A9D5DE49_9CRYT|nr:lipase/esterase [Cryptosporidium canis]